MVEVLSSFIDPQVAAPKVLQQQCFLIVKLYLESNTEREKEELLTELKFSQMHQIVISEIYLWLEL